MDAQEDKVKILLDQEEKLLISALRKAMLAYNENPTTQNLKAFQSAKKALEDFRKRQNTPQGPERFKNLLEVAEYLKGEGWKVGKSFLYQKAYLIKKQADGTILREDADAFAKQYLKKLDGSNIDADITQKLKAEVRKLKAEAEKRELEVLQIKGKLVDKYEVEQQLAARAAFLMESLRNFVHSQIPRVVEMVGGDIKYAADAIEFFQEELEKLFDYYSKPLVFNVSDEGEKGESGD